MDKIAHGEHSWQLSKLLQTYYILLQQIVDTSYSVLKFVLLKGGMIFQIYLSPVIFQFRHIQKMNKIYNFASLHQFFSQP